MNTQAKVLLNTLEAKGWFIDSIENPKSSSYWWVWEFWTIKRNQNKVVLSFLIDPQSEKRIQNVWAVTATKKEPTERLEAEKGILLSLGRHWEKGLMDFVTKLDQQNFLVEE